MAVTSPCSYNLLNFSFVSQLACQVQVEEEELGARLLPRASQTSACDLTELASLLWGWQCPGSLFWVGSAKVAIGEDEGEPGVWRTGEEALIPETCAAIRGLVGNPVFQVGRDGQSSGQLAQLHIGSSSQSWDQNPGSPSGSLKMGIIVLPSYPTPKADSQLPYVSLLL